MRSPTLRVEDVRYGFGTWIEMDGEKVLRFSDPGALGFTPWIDRETETGCVFAIQDRGPRVQLLMPFLREAVHEAVTSPAVTGTSETVRLRHDGQATVRELKVTGQAARLGVEDSGVQHRGLGTRLMGIAEEMSGDFDRLRVTHGVGTLEYYRKLGYEPDGSYVVKGL